MQTNKFICPLDNDLLLCLSSNAYYLNVVQNEESIYRIDSDEKIIFFKDIDANDWLKD